MLLGKKVGTKVGVLLLAIALSCQPLSALGAGTVLTHGDMVSHPTPPYPGQALINHESSKDSGLRFKGRVDSRLTAILRAVHRSPKQTK
jgi:hypothetical protein